MLGVPVSLTVAALVVQAAPAPLTTVVLGADGGLDESNLSAYLVAAPEGGYVLLDAGTVLHGIEVALTKGAFPDVERGLPREVAAAKVLREQTHAVFVTHAHLDHVAGLVVASPDDVPRTVYGLAPTIDALRDTAFNWKLWPNLGSEGAAPALKKITYARLDAAGVDVKGLHVTAMPLSHGGVQSTAFLVEVAPPPAPARPAPSTVGHAILYIGDTGPDSVEKSDKLLKVWERAAPLVREKKLRAVFIECSFPTSRPDDKLFGHMTPRHVSAELIRFANAVDPNKPGDALKGLTVVITHIKPTLEKGEPEPRAQIAKELAGMNTLGVRFVLAEQGQSLAFR